MSKPIPSVGVTLSSAQVAKIATIKDRALAADRAGKPGMVLAQIFGDQMRVFFLEHEAALELQRATGSEVGHASRTATVRRIPA